MWLPYSKLKKHSPLASLGASWLARFARFALGASPLVGSLERFSGLSSFAPSLLRSCTPLAPRSSSIAAFVVFAGVALFVRRGSRAPRSSFLVALRAPPLASCGRSAAGASPIGLASLGLLSDCWLARCAPPVVGVLLVAVAPLLYPPLVPRVGRSAPAPAHQPLPLWPLRGF